MEVLRDRHADDGAAAKDQESDAAECAALPLVLLLEALDAPGGVQEPLLAGEEGVALGADLHLDGRHGGAGVDDLPAVAGDRGVNVVRANASLHGAPPKWVSKHSRAPAKRQKPG